MHRLALLLERQPLVFAHLTLALAALALGAFILWGRKGGAAHRGLGWTWVALLAGVTLSSVFIRDPFLPNLAGFTPIHLIILVVAWQLPRAVWHARQGRIAAHRKAMRGLYQGGCLVAGLFALLPGRFLGTWLWQHALGPSA